MRLLAPPACPTELLILFQHKISSPSPMPLSIISIYYYDEVCCSHTGSALHFSSGHSLEMARTADEKKKLRDKAKQSITERDDVEIDEDETTANNNYPYMVWPAICGAIVDRRSSKGKVVITKRDGPSRVIQTDPDITGHQFIEVTIADGETCMIYGRSTLIYIRPQRHQ